MKTANVITELDAALVKAGATTDFEEEYPEASQQTIENAKRLEATRRQVESLVNTLSQQQQAKERQRAELQAKLKGEIEDIKTQVAAIAVRHGVATDEEKQLVKEARGETKQNGSQSDLGQVFDLSPTSQR